MKLDTPSSSDYHTHTNQQDNKSVTNLQVTPRKIFPWQQTQWQQLCNGYISKKLPHAILLNGQIGLGKFEFAKEFAKFLLCSDQNKTNLVIACDHCKQCNLVNKETSADLQIITLEEESNIIKLEQIKNLISYTNNTSQFNGFKIVIIYPAEKMNAAAANALLKNLEEPIGTSTIFILITHQFMSLAATVRSRCQRINFHVPALIDLKEWLKAQSIDIENADFDWAYQLSQGAPFALYEYLQSRTQIELLQTLNSLFIDKGWLMSEWAIKLNKLSVMDFITCLQITLINLIKFDNKIKKDSLHYLLDEVSNHKKALNKGIALNAQLIIEYYLNKIKGIEETNG